MARSSGDRQRRAATARINLLARAEVVLHRILRRQSLRTFFDAFKAVAAQGRRELRRDLNVVSYRTARLLLTWRLQKTAFEEWRVARPPSAPWRLQKTAFEEWRVAYPPSAPWPPPPPPGLGPPSTQFQ